ERVDVRVIAATNKELDARLKDGSFREDLYYRLNVIQIQLPALRDRAEDILPLSEHFLAVAAGRAGKEIRGFQEGAKKALLAHTWPGKGGELENVIERAVALAETATVGVDDLPPAVRERKSSAEDTLGTALARGLTLDELEQEFIQRVL